METETTIVRQKTVVDRNPIAVEIVAEVRRAEVLLKAGALQNAIFNSANFSIIATDEKGVVKNSESGFTLQASMQIERDAFNVTPAAADQKVEVDVIGAAIDDRGQIYSFKQVLTVIPPNAPDAAETPVMWGQQLRVQLVD